MDHIHSILLGALLGCCLAICKPAVAQRSFGPSLTKDLRSSSIRERVADIYLAEVGTLEIGKNNHGPGPKKYLASCGLNEGFAYCACFVKWVLESAQIETEGGTAWSPSWFPKERVIWRNGKIDPGYANRNPGNGKPQRGDVFGLYFSKLGRIGHVGFIDQWGGPRADDWVFTVEGNTNGEGSREGDGVHARRRHKRHIHIIANWID